MTREEAIRELSYIADEMPSMECGDWKEAIYMAIKALEKEPCEIIKEIPKDYRYDTETEDFLVYRHKYTGHEIHIEKPVSRYRLEQEPILDKIRADIETARFVDKDTKLCKNANASGLEVAMQIIDKYRAEKSE